MTRIKMLPSYIAIVMVVLSIVLSYASWGFMRDGAQTSESVQTCESYDATTQTCESYVTTVTTTQTYESYGATLRNIAVLLGGVAALAFAIWRSVVAQKQLDVAQRGLLNDRYQKGAEMLGNNSSLAVRLGGINALRNLAGEHPKQYHIQVMTLLCAFVRHPPSGEEIPPDDDTQAAMDMIGYRQPVLIKLEEEDGFVPNLSRALLYSVNLTGANLSGANLTGAKLSGANLTGAVLSSTNLTDAFLSVEYLRYATLPGVQGLKQSQLNQAVAESRYPPKLEGVLDAETGEQLEWRGGVPNDEPR